MSDFKEQFMQIYTRTSPRDFEWFLQCDERNAWVHEPGIELYLRKTPTALWPVRGHFQLASMNAIRPGSGALTRFLDQWEPHFGFYIENVLNPRLIPYLQKRGYVLSTPYDQPLHCFLRLQA